MTASGPVDVELRIYLPEDIRRHYKKEWPFAHSDGSARGSIRMVERPRDGDLIEITLQDLPNTLNLQVGRSFFTTDSLLQHKLAWLVVTATFMRRYSVSVTKQEMQEVELFMAALRTAKWK
ncbi:MAG: hypothetical protein KBE09_02470 [Candidatus Pacebacteria bacterium]|nr:hypothetical protein [Candidatus Paceibacterota bacterium]